MGIYAGTNSTRCKHEAFFVDWRNLGDVNGDGTVDIVDLSQLSAHWYPGPPVGPLGYDLAADVNDDGAVNMVDVSILSAYWTGPPKGPLARKL